MEHVSPGPRLRTDQGISRAAPLAARVASAGVRGGYTDGAGVAGACGCFDDDDLYACAEQAGAGGEKSGGQVDPVRKGLRTGNSKF